MTIEQEQGAGAQHPVSQGRLVKLAREGAVATITLDRPERRNALGDDLLRELLGHLAELRDDASIRAVILAAAPPVFSAGAETRVKADTPEDEKRGAFAGRKSQFRRLFERATALLEALEQPTIAAIPGPAVGGGWGLALACDFRVASTKARFWIPEVDLGVNLGVGTTARLIRLAGPAIAKELILLCNRISAEDALALHLVTAVVAPEELEARSRELALRLAGKPFEPLSQMKARINMISRNGMPEVNAATDGFLAR